MKPRSVRFAPPIPTAATRSLELSVTRLARRRSEVEATVDAIRAGDNDKLLELVYQARAGDADAATLAIWSLLPRLCAVVRSRMTPADWRCATDEYLSIAYLTIRDVGSDEAATFLADKIVARVRQRHERRVAADRRFGGHLTTTDSAPLEWRATDVVEKHALVRVRLHELLHAASADPRVRSDLDVVVASMQQAERVPGPQRMAVLRSRRRLVLHLGEAA
jgi:hypothetical protein